MTLLDAWQEGGITVPWTRLAKGNREKLFRHNHEGFCTYESWC